MTVNIVGFWFRKTGRPPRWRNQHSPPLGTHKIMCQKFTGNTILLLMRIGEREREERTWKVQKKEPSGDWQKRSEHAPAKACPSYNCLRVLTLFCHSLSLSLSLPDKNKKSFEILLQSEAARFLCISECWIADLLTPCTRTTSTAFLSSRNSDPDLTPHRKSIKIHTLNTN